MSLIFLCLLLCFPTKEDSHAASLFLSAPRLLQKEKPGIPLAFFSKTPHEPVTRDTHDITAPRTAPRSPCSFYFTSPAAGVCVSSRHVLFLVKGAPVKNPSLFQHGSNCCTSSAQEDKGKLHMCASVCICAHVKKATDRNAMFVCVRLGL